MGKFYLRDEYSVMQTKIFFVKINFHQMESVQIMYDSHGQTFLSTLYFQLVQQHAK